MFGDVSAVILRAINLAAEDRSIGTVWFLGLNPGRFIFWVFIKSEVYRRRIKDTTDSPSRIGEADSTDLFEGHNDGARAELLGYL